MPEGPRGEKRPTDANQLAKMIIDVAPREAADRPRMKGLWRLRARAARPGRRLFRRSRALRLLGRLRRSVGRLLGNKEV